MNNNPERQKRVVVYCPHKLYRRLASVLALEGSNVSKWFRKQAEQKTDERRKNDP
jgi:hypothetical protein